MIEWKKEYEVGHLMLDVEHQELFDIANEAFAVVPPEEKKRKITIIINKLTRYLKKHIKHEESYMMILGYPELDDQQNMHKKIYEEFEKWKPDYTTKSINIIEKELAYGIEKYIVNHIKYEDVKLREWAEEKAIDLKYIVWKDSYKIGDDLIDSEHQRLFELSHEAFNTVPLTKRKEKIKRIIHELYAYMKNHFAHEETLMTSLKYPELAEHLAMHKAISDAMHLFIKKVSTCSLDALEDKLALFIEEWLIFHVIYEDIKISRSKDQV